MRSRQWEHCPLQAEWRSLRGSQTSQRCAPGLRASRTLRKPTPRLGPQCFVVASPADDHRKEWAMPRLASGVAWHSSCPVYTVVSPRYSLESPESTSSYCPPHLKAGNRVFPPKPFWLLILEKQPEGHLGGSVGEASAFGLSHDLRVLGSSPESGSLLSGESASPSPSACCSPCLCTWSLSLTNK